jgi:hypothetical protein
MKRSRHIAALAMLPAISAVALALTGSAPLDANAGGASPGGDGGAPRYRNVRYGLSVTIPPRWHRSRARLVPELLAPREVVSLGNFGMRVGGGGNCGREPAASIARMRPGDALVSLQEAPVHPRLRLHLRRNYPPLPPHFRVSDLRRVPGAGPSGVRLATLAFSDDGRAFEALVYVDGAAAPALRADIDSIFDGLRFRPGSWDRFHGDELPAT